MPLAIHSVTPWLTLWTGPRNAINPVFIYDGDCGFCQRSVRVLQAWRVKAHFQANHDSQALLSQVGLTLADSQRYALWLEQDTNGSWQVARGAGAISAALSCCTGVWPGLPLRLISPLYDWPFVKPLVDWVYRWVADHRYWLSKGTCSLPEH
jgi:predicted DCC family thiol-disulfide oxidoreductase YuxK